MPITPHVPTSNVKLYSRTLEDIHPSTNAKTQVKMAYKMEAILSSIPPSDTRFRGSRPDGRAEWWPAFQKRHATDGQFWVQGHLLNDNVYGPGIPDNLVPITGTLNTNMLNLVEVAVKSAVDSGKIIHYVVEAHWDQTPAITRKNYGLIDDGSGSLIWGEQFAPTRLSWSVSELTFDTSGNLLQSPLKHGSPWYTDTSQWMNHFPQ